MEENKYELTDETIEWKGHILHRIKALKDFRCNGFSITTGQLGGFIESESNLSQEGNCWVNYNASIYGDAKVYENAILLDDSFAHDNARIHGNAIIHDEARIYDNAEIYDCAEIFGNAQVYGSSKVYGTSRLYQGFSNSHVNIGETTKPQSVTIEETTEKDETNVLKETNFYYVDIYIVNVDLGCEKIDSIMIETDIQDKDYLSFLIKKKHNWLDIPTSLRFIDIKCETYFKNK